MRDRSGWLLTAGAVVAGVVAGCGGGGERRGEPELEAACGAMEDEGIDGTVDVVWVHAIDGEGRIVEKAGDRDGDGAPEEVFTYEWNEDGRLLVEEIPLGYHRSRYERAWEGVNLVELRQLYDQGDGFELVRRRVSTYGDGGEDEEVWDWDGDGDLVASGRLELKEADEDGDGVLERRETFEYEEGRIVRSTVTAGGSPLYVSWTYEGDALVEKKGFDSDVVPPNAIPDYRETWTLDDSDLVVEHYRASASGTSTTTTVRDEGGRPVEIRVEGGFGAEPTDVQRMEYDGDRMLRHEIRTPLEATVYEFQFDCGG